MKKITVRKINLSQVEPATVGKLARYRAERINVNIKNYIGKFKVGDILEYDTKMSQCRGHSSAIALECLGIYSIPGKKGSIPLRANIMLDKDGEVFVQVNYHQEAWYRFVPEDKTRKKYLSYNEVNQYGRSYGTVYVPYEKISPDMWEEPWAEIVYLSEEEIADLFDRMYESSDSWNQTTIY